MRAGRSLVFLLLASAALAVSAEPESPTPAARKRTPGTARSHGDPYARVQQAKAAFDAGQYERALRIVDRLLAEYPRSQSSHLLRALALDELGRAAEAERSFNAALRIAPQDPQILTRYGMHLIRAERWGDALSVFAQSAELAPEAETLFYLAQAYSHTDAKAKALETIEKAATLAPADATILLKLGEYRAQAQRYSPALEALSRARQIDPAAPGLDLALGIVHLALLEVEEARAVLERALAKEPDNLAVLSNLAQACSKARDHAAARTYYQRLIDRGQHEGPYYLGLGSALLGTGEPEAAIEALRTAASRSPELAEIHFHLARAYRAAGRPEDSQRELRSFQALKANPLQPFSQRSDFEKDLWQRAEALLVAGKEEQAVELLAGGNVPGNEPSYLVGALYYKLGRYADAERLLTRALSAAPKLPRLRAYLGLARLEQGKLATAEQVIREEAEQNPREPLLLMAQGQLHYRRKEWDQAARALSESKIVEPPVLLMLLEAQLESGQTAAARETAQLVGTFGAGQPEVALALDRLLARHPLPPESRSSS